MSSVLNLRMARKHKFHRQLLRQKLERQRLKQSWIHPQHASLAQVNTLLKTPLSREASLEDLIRRPEVTYKDLMQIEGVGPGLSMQDAAEQVEIQIKYEGYINRQHEDVAQMKRLEDTKIPVDFDYDIVSGLSREITLKLKDVRPETLAQANRIPGVTPAAVQLIMITIRKNAQTKKSA